MKKSFFVLICGSLMFAAIMAACGSLNSVATTTFRVQCCDHVAHDQCYVIDSVFFDPNPEVRKLALENSDDPHVFRFVALNDREPELRKLALAKSTDQNVFRHVALNDRDPEIRKIAFERLQK